MEKIISMYIGSTEYIESYREFMKLGMKERNDSLVDIETLLKDILNLKGLEFEFIYDKICNNRIFAEDIAFLQGMKFAFQIADCIGGIKNV